MATIFTETFNVTMPYAGHTFADLGGYSDWVADDWQGIYAIDDANNCLYAATYYYDGAKPAGPGLGDTGADVTILSRISLSDGTRIDSIPDWDYEHYETGAQMIVDSDGYLYIAGSAGDGSGVRLWKLHPDLTVVTTGSYIEPQTFFTSGNGAGGGLLRLVDKDASHKYIAMIGRTTSSTNYGPISIINRSDCSELVTANVGDNTVPSGGCTFQWVSLAGSMIVDNSGDLWIGWWDVTRAWQFHFETDGSYSVTEQTLPVPDSQTYTVCGFGLFHPANELNAFFFDPATNSLITWYNVTDTSIFRVYDHSVWVKIDLNTLTATKTLNPYGGPTLFNQGSWGLLQFGFGKASDPTHLLMYREYNSDATQIYLRTIDTDLNVTTLGGPLGQTGGTWGQFPIISNADATADANFDIVMLNSIGSAVITQPDDDPVADDGQSRWSIFFLSTPVVHNADQVTYKALTGSTFSATDVRGDGSPNNGTVTFFLNDFVTEEDVLAGLYDGAEIEYREVNWTDLAQGDLKIMKGTLGHVTIKNGMATAELRGLADKLRILQGRTYGPVCRAQLFSDGVTIGVGDHWLCRLNRADWVQTGTVASSADAITLVPNSGLIQKGPPYPTSPPNAAPAHWFDDGLVIFKTGRLSGYTLEVQTWDGTTLTMFEPMPFQPEAGDEFEIEPGCPKDFPTCASKFANGDNFQGEKAMPGPYVVLNYPNSH